MRLRGCALLSLLATACTSSTPASKTDAFELDERIVESNPKPPPLHGGTIEVADGIVFAVDPDRDVLWVVDLESLSVIDSVELPAESLPGRVSVKNGTVLVGLRQTGELAVVESTTDDWELVAQHDACDHLAGVTWLDETRAIVACLGGNLRIVNVASGVGEREIHVEPDLRDVVVDSDGRVYVSIFRRAVVKVFDVEDFSELGELVPVTGIGGHPATIFRMVLHPRGGVLLTHQIAASGADRLIELDAKTTSPYGDQGNCRVSVMSATISHLRLDREPRGGRPMGDTVMAVDVAISNNRLDPQIALAVAGNHNERNAVGHTHVADDEAILLGVELGLSSHVCNPLGQRRSDGSQTVAVDFDADDELVVQTRAPWKLLHKSRELELPGVSRTDTGYDMFHQDPGGGIACASCHPFGRDDGQTWHFVGEAISGPRRTPPVFGGVAGTAPFHWSGDVQDFSVLMQEIFSRRMGGANLEAAYSGVLGRYVNSIRAVSFPSLMDEEKFARGRFVFEKASCVDCHAGAQLSNNTTVNVGTGEAFQVPRLLGMRIRAPYMHNGCADDLRTRFTDDSCGGGEAHGRVDVLTDAELDDLLHYVGSL